MYQQVWIFMEESASGKTRVAAVYLRHQRAIEAINLKIEDDNRSNNRKGYRYWIESYDMVTE